jgi:hypothetical protein
MRIISGIAALGAGLMAASVAMAADPPDLVGTWKATGESHASVRLGQGDDDDEAADTPAFGSPENAWTIVISEQKGRGFHGVAQSPQGESETFVGVIAFDGEHFLGAGDAAAVYGELLPGGKLDFCYQDHEDGLAHVACFVAAKQ